MSLVWEVIEESTSGGGAVGLRVCIQVSSI